MKKVLKIKNYIFRRKSTAYIQTGIQAKKQIQKIQHNENCKELAKSMESNKI